jgi:hypothetical protein
METLSTWNFLAKVGCQIIAQREAAGLPTDVVPEKVTIQCSDMDTAPPPHC